MTWNGVAVPAFWGKGFSSSEFVSTDNARPSTFGGIACNTASTGWTSQYNGWMCTAAYEAVCFFVIIIE